MSTQRKPILWLSVLLTFLLGMVLTACSSSPSQSGTDAAQSDAQASGSSAGASDNAFPVTITTEFGDVTIPRAPQRVVALGWGDAELALSFGVEPVGAADWLAFGGDGVGPWSAGYTNPPTILGTMELSYEEVAALSPDVILDVRSSGDQERYDRLSAIAPTVGVAPGAANYLTSTADQVTMIGAALGKSAQAKQMLEDSDQAFAAVKEAHPQWNEKTVTVATRTSETWGAYLEDSRVQFMENLGFVNNPSIVELKDQSTNQFSVNISSEQLNLFDADLIIGFPIFIETTQITDDPGFQQIPAVEAGRSVIIDGDLANAYSLATPQSWMWALDRITPMIEKALPNA